MSSFYETQRADQENIEFSGHLKVRYTLLQNAS
jgi:hypothetical protein